MLEFWLILKNLIMFLYVIKSLNNQCEKIIIRTFNY